MRLAAATNLGKAWLLVLILAAFFGAIGWAIGGYRTASFFVFCALLAAAAEDAERAERVAASG